MTSHNFHTDKFEKDCLVVFEKLLQAYKRAKQTTAWESDMKSLVEKLTQLPNDPFSIEIIELFQYHYLTLSEKIDTVIDKALSIRQHQESTQRFITVKQKFYNNLFLPRNTYLKSLRVFNHENEECYRVKGKIQVNFIKLIKWAIGYKCHSFTNALSFKQKTKQYNSLEIYNYSQYINLSNTTRADYYSFFCDYYGKAQLINYLNNKHTASSQSKNEVPYTSLISVQTLSTSQQVLWAYFFFRLMGLKLRVNTSVSTLVRFLHIINRIDVNTYKQSYYYTLAKSAPYLKEDKNLLKDLETVRLHFIQNKLPVDDIEKEVFLLVSL